MSTRVAVFNQGRIEQIGPPEAVYERPETEFVADFVGTSNIVVRDGRRLCLRPERIAFADAGVPGTVDDAVFVGSFTRYAVVTDQGERLVVLRQSDGSTLERGARVNLAWRDEDAFQLPAQPDPQEVT